MADYIYLLENRLSEAQRSALSAVREVARENGVTVFLVGGAVRDLTSGSPVRDLDVVVQGNALKLRKAMEASGAVVVGLTEAGQSLFVRFPGGVRMEIGSTLSVTYPKPGKPVYQPATILDDLRRRDFTANAMALSLNEGSYGLLMDPLNGVADIENRELRLASNYGFIEEPVRMIRAARFAARLGWELEEKTKARYENGKQEGYIAALSEFYRGYEAEEIVHEEDPLRVIRKLEAEGWMQVLAPGWTAAKANVADLEKVRESQTQMQMQGIHPDAAAINFPLLTAKMSVKEIQALKKSFPRQGFVAEIDAAEAEAREFAALLSGRAAAVPSTAYRVMASAKPEALLYVLYTTKAGALQAKLKSFLTEWPQARQKIPYGLMQEMRITPEIDGYADLVEKLFFELMDGKLGTVEEMRAFLEPYSPPAPPPPVHVRRPRNAKKDAKGKGKGKKGAVIAEIEDEDEAQDSDADDPAQESRRGAEEDEEAEDAAEDFNAVAELGGSGQERKNDVDDEDEEEEDDEPVAPRKAPPVKKAAPPVKASEPEPVAAAIDAEGPAVKSAARVAPASPAAKAREVAKPEDVKAASGAKVPPAVKVAAKAPAAKQEMTKSKPAVVAVPARAVAAKAETSKQKPSVPVKVAQTPAKAQPVKSAGKTPVKMAAKVPEKAAPAKSAVKVAAKAPVKKSR